MADCVTLAGLASNDSSASRVGTAGDVNGDGFADVIVGALRQRRGRDATPGAAYVYDFNRYFVTSPNGGETWTRNAHENVTWLGAEPADLWLSVDDGATYELLAERRRWRAVERRRGDTCRTWSPTRRG